MDQVSKGAISPKKRARSNRATSSSPRQRATRTLPTERITFGNQLKLLRAYAIASGPSGRTISNSDVASIVKMVPSTVALGNAFFTETGLLLKPNGSGFMPSPESLPDERLSADLER